MNLAIFRGSGFLRRASYRHAFLLAVVIGGILLAAGCGNHPRHTAAVDGGGKTPYERALAITQCMRQNGDPWFPEPGSNGAFPASALNNKSPLGHQVCAGHTLVIRPDRGLWHSRGTCHAPPASRISRANVFAASRWLPGSTCA
jgi:hypothetical protein